MCDCYELMLAKAEEQLAVKGKCLAEPLKVMFSNEFYGSKDEKTKIKKVALRIEGRYRLAKTDGTPFKSESHCHASVFFSFCPFCGEKLYPESTTTKEER